MEQWVCTFCGFAEVNSNSICSVCCDPRPKPGTLGGISPIDTVPKSIPSCVSPVSFWSCQACTFENSSEEVLCVICETKAPPSILEGISEVLTLETTPRQFIPPWCIPTKNVSENVNVLPKRVVSRLSADRKLDGLIVKVRQGDFAMQQVCVQVQCNDSRKWGDKLSEFLGSKNVLFNFIVKQTYRFRTFFWSFSRLNEELLTLACFDANEKLCISMDHPAITTVKLGYNLLWLRASELFAMVQSGTVQDLISSIRMEHGGTIAFVISDLYSEIKSSLNYRLKGELDSRSPFMSKEDCIAYLFDLHVSCNGYFTYKLIDDDADVFEYVYRVSKGLAESEYFVPLTAMKFCKPMKACVSRGTTDNKEWFNFLLQIPTVSESKAEAIVEIYPNLASLMTAYSHLPNDSGPELLANIQIGDKRMGPAVSRRVYEFLKT